MNTAAEDARIKKIIRRLEKAYPDAKIMLNYQNPWELLVATILSAQCTDKKVNEVTAMLFKKYNDLAAYVNADPAEFERDIRPTGFFRNKTAHILTSAKRLAETYHGQLPQSMTELLTFPGVARKTANIVLGNAFGIFEGIAVDTHVKRLSNRLGISDKTDPDKIEQDLMRLIPKSKWFRFTYLLIEHGRAVCDAKKPLCSLCQLNDICPSAGTFG